MKEERSQPTPRKYKRFLKHIMNSYTPTFRQSRDMDAFLESQKLQKLEQEEIENLERPITREEIETLIKNLPRHKSPGPDASRGNSIKCLKKKQYLFY